jgi:hypothetical protein
MEELVNQIQDVNSLIDRQFNQMKDNQEVYLFLYF